MQLNPKKILGALGRKYGGTTFQKFHKVYHAQLRNIKDFWGTVFILMGRKAPYSLDHDVDSRLYHDKPEDITKTGVIVILDGAIYHGGPTDRLRGILTAYRECRKKKLPFYIYWTQPFPLTDYLVPATFDWRINSDEISRSRINSKAVVIDDMTDRQSLWRLKAALFSPTPQLHLYTNADSARGEYARLYSELFKPSLVLQEEVNRHKKLLGKTYWTIATRFLTLLGDFDDWLGLELPPDQKKELLEKVISEVKRILKDVPANTRIHVTSDSKTFLDHIRNIDPRIYIVDGEIQNVDLIKRKNASAWLKTFTDQQLIMGAETVISLRTGMMYPSGFPRFAAEIGNARFIDHKF